MLGVVNTPRLTVRGQPDKNGLKLGVVTEGTVLDVLAQRNGWLEIQYQNRTAFVFDDYVELADRLPSRHGVVTAARLNVHGRPATGADVVGVAVRNTEITVEARLGEWYQILFNGQKAYVSRDFIKLIDKDIAPSLSVTPNELTEPAPPTVAIVRESRDGPSDLPPERQLPIAGTSLERKVASTWNNFGGLLQHLSNEKNIDVGCAVAVLCVESSGKGFDPANDSRMIIRFENHKFWKYWGRANADTFHQHFLYQQGQAWKGHQWRRDKDGKWLSFHGSQQAEWEVLAFARSLDNDAALFSISMGAPQIMGFNYQGIGYNSVQDMFDAFAAGIEPHITGLFDFMSPAMVKKLQARDFEGFAALYNGNGQKEKYGAWIKDHYDAYKRLV